MPEHDQLDDLLAPLRSPAVGGPPPAEIRRRGERRQRRTRALLATGVAAAVAAVAIPLTVGGSSDTRGETPVATDPTTTPSPTRVDTTTFLDDLDVTTGMRGRVQRGTTFDPGIDTCAAAALPGAVQDVASATVAQTEGQRRRWVFAYESDGGATAVFDALRTALPDCADAEVVDDGATSLAYVVGAARLDTGEATVVRVVLIGGYVLMDAADILGAGSDQVVEQTLTLLRDQATRLEADLRLQGDQPAPTDLEPPAGVGPVGLGMGRDALEALPGMDYTGPGAERCQPFAVPLGDDEVVTGTSGPRDVVSIDLPSGAPAAGLAIGDDASGLEVTADDGGSGDSGTATVEPADAPDRHYQVTVENGRVSAVSLVLDANDCGIF